VPLAKFCLPSIEQSNLFRILLHLPRQNRGVFVTDVN
jgi:hypothetical protein